MKMWYKNEPVYSDKSNATFSSSFLPQSEIVSQCCQNENKSKKSSQCFCVQAVLGWEHLPLFLLRGYMPKNAACGPVYNPGLQGLDSSIALEANIFRVTITCMFVDVVHHHCIINCIINKPSYRLCQIPVLGCRPWGCL